MTPEQRTKAERALRINDWTEDGGAWSRRADEYNGTYAGLTFDAAWRILSAQPMVKLGCYVQMKERAPGCMGRIR